VADDEVELPQRRQALLRDVAVDQLDVVEPECPDPLATLADVDRGKVDADGGRVWVHRCECDQVACGRAADLEHAGTRDIGGLESEKPCDRGQLTRRRSRMAV
jgi:hypothetical protein